MILSLEKPAKLMPTAEHNDTYQSDTNIAGTYVPNMSEEDRKKWKAKVIKRGDDPRVEIRKTVYGHRKDPRFAGYAQVLLIVRPDGSVVMSANGKICFDAPTFQEFKQAVDEAQVLLEGK